MNSKTREIEAKRQAEHQFIEWRDHYYEGEAMILTREFLLRRGACCGSGCRNCPYDDVDQHVSE